MLALLGNFDFTELLVIGVGALLVFGRRLPEVAMRAAAQIVRLRRAVSQMWREAGIEDELRRVRREIEAEVPPVRSPQKFVRDTLSEPFSKVDPGSVGPTPDAEPGSDPDSVRRTDPRTEATAGTSEGQGTAAEAGAEDERSSGDRTESPDGRESA